MNTSKKKLLSMVFSFRNEEENLPEFLKRLEGVLSKINYEYELIFVNDASTDKSLEILEKARLDNQRIKIINMSRNFGISAAVIAGFKHVTGDAVIYMDCDLQDPPELIPELVKKWEEGSDVVHTVRTKIGDKQPKYTVFKAREPTKLKYDLPLKTTGVSTFIELVGHKAYKHFVIAYSIYLVLFFSNKIGRIDKQLWQSYK
mgnify:CR=1 FL=1